MAVHMTVVEPRMKTGFLPGAREKVATSAVWLWPVDRGSIGYGLAAKAVSEAWDAAGIPSVLVDYHGHTLHEKRIGARPFVLIEYARHLANPPLRTQLREAASTRIAWVCADGEVLADAAAAYCRSCDLTITPSSASRRACTNAGLTDVMVLPCGVDAPAWNVPQPPRPPDDPVRFVWRGSDPYRKGLDIFLNAFLLVPGQVRATVILPTPDAVYEMKRTFADDRIAWVSGVHPVREIATILAGCDIAVAPSRSEGFNLCALEAMAAGLPLIYTAGTGMDDFAAAAGVGVRVDTYSPSMIDKGRWLDPSPAAFAREMRALSHDAERRKALSAHSRFRAASEPWQWSEIARRTARTLVNRELIQWP
jgi:glycosyltransferase involved in cell wall biosynthesis